MYIVEYTTHGELRDLAVSTPKELFSILWIIDNSVDVGAWRILNHTPQEFGWSPHWNRRVVTFEREDFSNTPKRTNRQIIQDRIDDEFDDFFEFPSDDKSSVSSVSCKLFAEHIINKAK